MKGELMIKRPLRVRSWVRATGFVVTIAAVALAVVPAATESNTKDSLEASVVVSNRGPIPACPVGGICPESVTENFVYVSNKNALSEVQNRQTRDTLTNAFVVTSVEQATFVNGVRYAGGDFTFTPPPDAFPGGAYSGHWPATVKCAPGAPSCNVVASPAIIPGERTVVDYVGWAHIADEPNGKYVFRYTVHGTLNGTPVDVTANSQPITMTE
jgi:hypothetical protein